MSQQLNRTFRNRRVIYKVVLIGTYLLIVSIAILLVISFSLHHTQALGLLGVCGVAALYVAATQQLARRNHYYAVAYLLVSFYALLATGIGWSWGINTPIGMLLFALVIVLAGILLTARHALFATLGIGAVLSALQVAVIFNWHKPDVSWMGNQSSFGDVLGYCIVFGMLALVSWLYTQEMERSLLHAEHAEDALLQQKSTLEEQVKKRTAQLREAQLEEMQQIYRFTELGQLGITLLHDLANYLTALTLEIEGIQSKEQSKAMTRVREITQYLEDIVDRTRSRMHGTTKNQTFNIIRKTSETLRFLQYKAAKAGVVIYWQPPARSWKCTGDADSLSQIITIITSNAIDAYNNTQETARLSVPRVVVTMERNDTDIVICISDWGGGIAESKHKHLFKPFHSTKESGLGLGLYIAKQTVEMRFSGTLVLGPNHDHTEFIITLPRRNEK